MLAHPLARLALAWGACGFLLLLALPLALRIAAGHDALEFLRGFLAEPAPGATRAGGSETVPLGAGLDARLWRPRGPSPYPGIVLIPGLTPHGKDDVRVGAAAALLAGAGRAVLVPDLPGLRAQRLQPDDAAVVARAIAWLAGDRAAGRDPLTLVAVSVGVAPALAAAAEPVAGARVGLVVGLGGYAEARTLVRHFTTGASGVEPRVARTFVADNLDLVRDPGDRAAVAAWLSGRALPATAGPEARAVIAVLENRDPARVDALLAALPPATQALLDALSPVRIVGRVRARLLLVHGRDDPAIPYTESVRLAAAAAPARTRLVLVDLVAHVEGLAPTRAQARDAVRLFSAVYELFRG